jgi:hypothetical protein
LRRESELTAPAENAKNGSHLRLKDSE